MSPLLKKSILVYGSILAAAIIFAAGWALGQQGLSQPAALTGNGVKTQAKASFGEVLDQRGMPEHLKLDVSFNVFWEAWDKIQNSFVDKPVGETKLLYGSMHGLVAALEDPFSSFLEPQVAEDFTEELKGRFEGIGAEIGIRDNRLTIIAPLSESPAEAAGLRGGDKIYAIDEFDTTGIRLDEAVNRIRGAKGTDVILTIFRQGEEGLRDITVTRDTIKIVSVTSNMREVSSDDQVALIKVTNFNADTGSRFRKAVNDALAQGAQGFIIDVRNNPGGFLDQSVELAGYWVESGQLVVRETFADGTESSYDSRGSAELAGFPTMVLVNSGSASASEILVGALQDYGLATAIGKTTFGKGSVQDLMELSDGSSLKLTIARWLTPNGRQIDNNGIEPDEDIDRSVEDINEDRDPQLDRALELLSEKLGN